MQIICMYKTSGNVGYYLWHTGEYEYKLGTCTKTIRTFRGLGLEEVKQKIKLQGILTEIPLEQEKKCYTQNYPQTNYMIY